MTLYLCILLVYEERVYEASAVLWVQCLLQVLDTTPHLFKIFTNIFHDSSNILQPWF